MNGKRITNNLLEGLMKKWGLQKMSIEKPPGDVCTSLEASRMFKVKA